MREEVASRHMDELNDVGSARLPMPQGGGFFVALVCVPTMAAPPRGLYSAEADGDTDASTSARGTFARATFWALARDRYAGMGVDVGAGWRGASGRPDARGLPLTAPAACEPALPCWGRRECCALLVCV